MKKIIFFIPPDQDKGLPELYKSTCLEFDDEAHDDDEKMFHAQHPVQRDEHEFLPKNIF